MATDIRLKETLPEVTEALVVTYTECSRINHLGHKPLPSREAIVDILADLLDILYPGYGRRQNLHIGNVEFHVGDVIDGLHDKMTQQIARVLRHDCEQSEEGLDFERLAQQKTIDFLKQLPELRYTLERERQLKTRWRSILSAGYEAGVPIYTSSPGDSTLGMNVAALRTDGYEVGFDPEVHIRTSR